MLKAVYSRVGWIAVTMLTVAILFVSRGFAEENAAVRVNGRTFSTEEVQQYLNETAANMPLALGVTAREMFEQAPEDFLTAGAEHFVTVAIVEDKLHAKGLDQISAEEEESLQDYARQTYELLWQTVSDRMKEEYPNESWTERAVTETMESIGYSMDGIYEKALQTLLMDRFATAYCPEAVVTDEEVREFYRTTYTEPDRKLYENDIGLFEDRVLFGGETSTYVPEGYFYVKYITLRPAAERTEALEQAERALAEAKREAEDAETALARAAMEEEDLTEARARYTAAKEAEQQAFSMIEELTLQAEADYAPMGELVRNALKAGESFESLIGRHSIQQSFTGRDEPGYPFHPDSPNWEENVRERIAALHARNECTDPVYTGGNICIYCRMDDMPGGEYEPDEAAWNELSTSLLQAKQNEAIDEKIAAWRADYDIVIDVTSLVFPMD